MKQTLGMLAIAFLLLMGVTFLGNSQSVSNPPLVMQNGGTPIGAAAILNCGAGQNCSASDGLVTIIPGPTVVQTNQSNTYSTGTQNFSSAVHTAPTIVVAATGALPSTGCVNGELAVVTGATLGQQLYENSGTGACVWTQQLNSGSSSGGGFGGYSSAAAITFTGTLFFPIVGGGAPSSTETNVDVDSPASATTTNFYAQLVSAPGMGNSIAFTFRKNATDQSVTCTISGAVATSCNDTAHSFNVSQGDLLTLKAVTTGVIAGTLNLTFTFQFGNITATGTVNTGTAGQFGYYAANGAAISSATGMNTHGVVLYEGTSAPTSTAALGLDTLLQGQGASADPAAVAVGNCSTALTYSTSTHNFGCGTSGPSTNQNIRSVGASFSGGGSALTTSTVAYVTMPPACTIAAWNITIDTGTISFDVWKIATGTAIPTVANTIMTGGFLAVASGTAIHSTSLTNFTTTTVTANDIFAFEIQAVASATLATINLQCNATT